MSDAGHLPPQIGQTFLGVSVTVEDGCWIWRGYIRQDGYGQLGRSALAHVAAHEAAIGPVPPRYEVHHTCERKACVNPAHLVAVTKVQHKRLTFARIDRCPQGHLYAPDNTAFRPSGARKCKECDRIRHRVAA